MSFKRIQLIHECLIELGELLKTRFNHLKEIGKITPEMEFARQPEEEEFEEENTYYANRYNEINESGNDESLNALYAEWCNYIRNHYKGALRFIKNAADREVQKTSTTDNEAMGSMGDKKQMNGFQKTTSENKEDKTKEKDDTQGNKNNKNSVNNEGADEYYDSSQEFKGYKQ